MKYFITIVIWLLVPVLLNAQENTVAVHETQDETHTKKITQEAAILYGSTIIPEHNEHGEKIGYAFLPAISLDYDVWYNHKVGIILMNELVLNSYEIKTNEDEFITRESILIVSLNLAYSPFKNMAVFAGYGTEFELGRGEDFGVFRLGVAYSIPIRNNWSSIIALNGDFRSQYASGSFEIGFAKHF